LNEQKGASRQPEPSGRILSPRAIKLKRPDKLREAASLGEPRFHERQLAALPSGRGSGMKASQYWLLFAICAVGWLAAYSILPPMMSGTDVFMFRDAGWNLAAYGHFESAGLMYMPDLVPRFYAHYTPIMPLLFAGYLKVFPRNAYAGTLFNLFIGLSAAAAALGQVLAQPATRLRNWTALAIAVLPVLFVADDRPEALGLALFVATIAVAEASSARPIAVGSLIALTFLAHPFSAVAAAIWVFALFLNRNWSGPRRWSLTLQEIAYAAATALVPLIAVAFLYHALDPTSLTRFLAHTRGPRSGIRIGVHGGESGTFLRGVRWSAFGVSGLAAWNYLSSLAAVLLLIAWSAFRSRKLGASAWTLVAAAACCTLTAAILFSYEYHYVDELALLLPLGLLVAESHRSRLAPVGICLLLVALVSRLPFLGFGLLVRSEQGPSYRAALQQPRFLSSQIASPDAPITVEGDSYDVFKPQFHHMIHLRDAENIHDFAGLAGVANCYDGFHGTGLRPFPERLNAAEFHLVQADPQHLWITLFGHRVTRAQWGYGCDLYVRNSASSEDGH
jgi:hypothetical protein